MTVKIRVEGLREFRSALAEVDKGLKKEVRLVLNDAANLVVKGAKPSVPKTSGKAGGSVRAQSTQKLSRVSGGGSRAPYYPWLDFGGSVGRGGATKRAYSREGRYIYPTYRKAMESGEFQERMKTGLDALGAKAGLDMS